ncbi:MAG: hypothetical protein ACK5ZG_07235 [Phycisphaerae bacterium]|jgi:hypothetical protein
MRFDRVIMVDWSATSGVTRPGPDTIHVAWNDGHVAWNDGGAAAVQHCATRLAAQELVAGLCLCKGRVLVGMDFAFGYPADSGLPSGRELCAMMADRVTETQAGVSNRFAVAAQLNRELALRGGVGPFWGRAASVDEPDLPTRRPVTGKAEFRVVERAALARVKEWGRIQSAFKCAYPASVGSQTITGLACVGRLLRDERLAKRAVLWPFETRWDEAVAADAVVFAEVWPATQVERVRADTSEDYRDAKQVRAMVEWAAQARDVLARPAGLVDEDVVMREGWILGIACD